MLSFPFCFPENLETQIQTVLCSVSNFACVFSLFRCDFNMYNIRYAVALSKQRGMKRAAEEDEGVEEEEDDEEELSEEMSEASLEDAEMVL